MLVFAKLLDGAFLDRVEHDFGLNKLGFARSGAAANRRACPRSAGRARRGAHRRDRLGALAPGANPTGLADPGPARLIAVFTLFTQIVLRSIRRATAVVRQSEARFRDIAEAASDWIWETDRGLMLTYVSEQFGGATGLNPADVLARPLHRILELCDQSPGAQQTADLRAALRISGVLCLLHADGGKNTRTLRVAGKPMLDTTASSVAIAARRRTSPPRSPPCAKSSSSPAMIR